MALLTGRRASDGRGGRRGVQALIAAGVFAFVCVYAMSGSVPGEFNADAAAMEHVGSEGARASAGSAGNDRGAPERNAGAAPAVDTSPPSSPAGAPQPVPGSVAHPWYESWPDTENGAYDAMIAAGADIRFARAVRAVWRRQNPGDCSTAKFMVHDFKYSGFGSVMHTIGRSLIAAFSSGRVLVPNPSSPFFYAQDPWCAERGKDGSPSCYFHPWSHCTVTAADVAQATTRNVCSRDDLASDARFVRCRRGPLVFEETDPRDSEIFSLFNYHGIMAQAAVALGHHMRLNTETAARVKEMRSRLKGPAGREVPSSCAYAFVRHGDKATESRLLPLSQYVGVLEDLASTGFVSRDLVLSTDDPKVVSEALNMQQAGRLQGVYYTDYPRKQFRSIKAQVKELGKANEVVHSTLNALLPLECRAFVCTDTSNTGRLVREMRYLWGRQHTVYVDLSVYRDDVDLAYFDRLPGRGLTDNW